MLCFPSRTGGADPRFPFLFTGKRREAAQVRGLVYVDPQGRLVGGGKEREKKRRGGIDLVFTDTD